jgi:hypothetical protein
LALIGIDMVETHSDVSQAMEGLHVKAARLVLMLESAAIAAEYDEPEESLLSLLSSLLDEIDVLRALHLRVVMRCRRTLVINFLGCRRQSSCIEAIEMNPIECSDS